MDGLSHVPTARGPYQPVILFPCVFDVDEPSNILCILFLELLQNMYNPAAPRKAGLASSISPSVRPLLDFVAQPIPRLVADSCDEDFHTQRYTLVELKYRLRARPPLKMTFSSSVALREHG